MPDSREHRNGTILAFDFGVKRIGVAVGEWPLAQAHPLKTIHGESNEARFRSIGMLIREWTPVSLVVGLPVALDGAEHDMTARCIRFANQLRGRFGLPVEYAEERLSSSEASERLRDCGYNAQSAKPHLDAVAAQIILQLYFQEISKTTSMETAHVSPHIT